MRHFPLRRLRAAAAITVLLLSSICGTAGAIDTTTPFVGTFDGHLLAGTPGCTTTTTDRGKDGRVTVTFDCSANASQAGLIHGTVTVDFPDATPIAHYDSTGVRLLFDAPVVTRLTADEIWNATRPNSDGQLTLDTYDSDQSADAPQCSFDSGDKKIAQGSTAEFQGSIECVWTSMADVVGASVPFAVTPFVLLQSDSTFFALANGGGEFVGLSFVSSYSFHQTAPPTADLSVDHLEVVQTTQSDSDFWEAVAGKKTVVRVFPKFTDTDASHASVSGVSASLRGFHGTTELPGSPLTQSYTGNVTAARTIDRDRPDSSLNILLPPAWTTAGDLTLTATVNPNHTIPETNYGNNSLTATKTVFGTRGYSIAYVPVCYLDLQHCPSNTITRYAAMASEMYPVPDNGLSYTPLRIPRIVYPFPVEKFRDQFSLLAFLQLLYSLDQATGGTADQLVGWLPLMKSKEIFSGFSDPVFDGGQGKVLFAQDYGSLDPGAPDDQRLGSYVLAHEAAHNLGLRHTDLTRDGDGCGAYDSSSEFARFYQDGKSTIHDPGFSLFGALFYTSKTKDLMTQCTQDLLWISGFDYEHLLAGINPSGPSEAQPQAAVEASDQVVVGGRVARDGTSGSIDSIVRITSAAPAPATDPAGSHCLAFSAAGVSATPYCFTARFDAENLGQPGLLADESTFTVRALLPPNTDRVALLAGASELASVARSAHAPMVSITAPPAGDVWTGERTLSWTASDADGDPLTFTVLTSSDNGATWIPVAVNLTARQQTIESAELAAGHQTLFRVLASDGFETASATAGPVTVDPQPFLEATPQLKFGSVPAGHSSTQRVLVTNAGDLEAHVTSVASGNPQLTASPALPVAVPAGGAAEIAVVFSPSAAGPVSATLTLSTDDPQNPSLAVAITGGGCVPHDSARCVTPVPVSPPGVVRRGGP
jgi:hypothetical protein